MEEPLAPLATLDELRPRLGYEMDEAEEAMAEAALEEASELVRAFGCATWEVWNCPPIAKQVVLRAVKRYMTNPEGYIQSRAGDETVILSDGGVEMQSVFLTETEKKLLARAAGGNRLTSVPTTAWGRMRRSPYTDQPGYVPVAGGGKPFPFFPSGEGPW